MHIYGMMKEALSLTSPHAWLSGLLQKNAMISDKFDQSSHSCRRRVLASSFPEGLFLASAKSKAHELVLRWPSPIPPLHISSPLVLLHPFPRFQLPCSATPKNEQRTRAPPPTFDTHACRGSPGQTVRKGALGDSYNRTLSLASCRPL